MAYLKPDYFIMSLIDNHCDLQFLKDNFYPGTEFMGNFKELIDDDDSDKILNEVIKKYTIDLNQIIEKLIKDNTIEIIEIPEYMEKLEKIGLDSDIPEKGIFIQGKPNFNGSIILFMLGSAASDKTFSDDFSNRIFNVFQQDDITKIYQDYISIFDEFITCTYNNLEGVEIAKDKLMETTQNAEALLEKSIKFIKLKKEVEELEELGKLENLISIVSSLDNIVSYLEQKKLDGKF